MEEGVKISKSSIYMTNYDGNGWCEIPLHLGKRNESIAWKTFFL